MQIMLPTERLDIPTMESLGIDNEDDYSAYTVSLVLTKADEIVAAGERPWFEVWFPDDTPESFDAVEVIDGVITTTKPYTELLNGGTE